MARMIPASALKTASYGEIEIFRRLRDAPSASDWIVLHSLDIANHIKRLSGEVDFVVIVPGKGVLCLEVKACSRLRREAGSWYYGADRKPDRRGPFRQASEGMHSLRKQLIKTRPDLAHVVFWSAVIFPFVPFDVRSGEWHPWQVIDSQLFRARPLDRLLLSVLNHARAFLDHSGAGWHRKDAGEPTGEQSTIIAELLRPNFEIFESPKSRLRHLGEELKNYTKEQFQALDSMAVNQRIVFEGPAGTGKTLLAIEAARRACNSENRVLFVCFNRLLGRWLDDQTEDLRPDVVTRTLHSHMLAVASCSPPDEGGGVPFWQEELPYLAMEALLQEPENNVFDQLIVDEAQDILLNNYMDFLDLSLKGGLSTGKWQFFGDFEKQAIYDRGTLPLDQFVSTRGGGATRFRLRANCRNTPRIAALAEMLGGLDPEYSQILRPDDGVEPDLFYYEDAEALQARLVQTLDLLKSEGFSGQQIVILSARGRKACAAAKIISGPWAGALCPAEQAYGNKIVYCSVHAFKGLEAPAVVVTDIEGLSDLTDIALFYVSTTRALSRLVIIVHEKAKPEIMRALLR